MSTSNAMPGPCATSATEAPAPAPALPSPRPDAAQSASGPKGKGKGKGRRREDESPDVKISKALSYILRHGAAKEGLKMRPDGYVRVDDILKRPKLKGVDVDMLRRIVAENNKQRYALSEEPASSTSTGLGDASTGTVLWIRANQGHSLAVDDLELVRIQDASECPVVVHGTFSRHWDAIRSEGLKVMGRHHIHCASGLFGEEGVTSGMRASCDLFVYINITKALADGVVFERSANGVILTKGQNGTLKPKYFERVQNKKGETIWPEAQ